MEKNQQEQHDEITLKLRELIWDNKIPVKITIDREDIANDQEDPFPLFIFIHRIHYPAIIYSQIHKFFERYCPIPLAESDIWLEWNQKPIPWNIPFGVFFDLNYDDHGDQLPSFQPIDITLHYRNYPTQLLPLEKNVEDHIKRDYKYALKEASIIRYGCQEGCKNIIQDQTVTEWEEMWRGYVSCDMNVFYERWDDKIWKPKSNERAQLPLRIYISGYTGRIQEAAEIKDADYTLGQYLCETFPKIFSKCQDFYQIAENFSEIKILSHGIDCDLNMPLLYFLRRFYYPDGFSYIVIIL